MKMMHLFLLLLLTTAMALVAPAATTNWPFTTASEYVLSDSNKIEVTDGVAKLKLTSQQIYQTTMDAYLQTNASRYHVSLGPDASLVLVKTSGVYASPAQFESRVMQGGIGNAWQRFFVRVSNKALDVENVPGGIASNETGLVALYRMDGDWTDATTGLSGTPGGSPQFTTHAKFGSGAALLPGNSYLVMNNSNLLNNATAFTISFWMYMTSGTPSAGLVSSRPSANQLTGFRYGAGGNTLECYVNGAKFLETSSLSLGLWYYVTMTWVGGNSARGKIYFNGTLAYDVPTPTYTSIFEDRPFMVGNDNFTYARGRFDEVAIYNRTLSAAEVQELYDRASPAKFQIRSGTSLPLASTYVGPDGTAGSYYFMANTPLLSSSDFSIYHPYVQYRAYLVSDVNHTASPYVESVGFDGSAAFVMDTAFGDFLQGMTFLNVTNMPAQAGTPYLGVASGRNGASLTNATYTSRVLDGGPGVSWGQLSWRRLGELQSDLTGLQGLWHLNGTWADDSTNKLSGGSGVNVSFTDNAKLGLRSAVFNGVDAYGVLPTTPLTVNSVEFWLRNENPSDGLMELSPSIYLSISNSWVIPTGFSSSITPSLYINARPNAPLLPGWNHIALVTAQSTLTNVSLKLGVANGDYFEGQMDEVAVFNRQLTLAEIVEHYDSGRRAVAGRVRVQVRADTNNPPQTAFSGPASLPGYFTDPSGTPLGSFSGRYMQYRVTLEGDGTATPALDDITITSSSSNFVDNALGQFVLGSYDADASRWYGDEISLLDFNPSGPASVDPSVTPDLMGVWHMDETTWAGGVLDASGNGYHGTVEGVAGPTTLSRVGPRCGSFPGTGSDILVPGIDLSSNDFTVAMWVNSSSAARSALMTTYSGAGSYYALEFNGNGTAVDTGRVAFVLSNGSVIKSIASDVRKLNDSGWHHVAGLRNGRQLHIYVDGRLAGTTDIGSGFGSMGAGSAWIGKYGTLGLAYAGSIDEVVIARRALTEAEIGSFAAAGPYMLQVGTFTGPVIDSLQMTIWQTLWWGEDAPYSRALKPGDAALSGLWHLDAVTNGTTVVDSSVWAHDGTVVGGGITNAGRFGGALKLAEGAGQSVTVADEAALKLVPFSLEAWINPEDVLGHVIVDKRNAGQGYRLALDVSGRPVFWVNGTSCTSAETIRSRKWTHVAGVCDGAWLRLYVNGVLKAKVASSVSDVSTGSSLLIGLGYDSSSGFYGCIDEVALSSKVLSGVELLDHYRAGAVTLKFQAQSWTGGAPGGFVGPDGTSATYFTDAYASTLVNAIPLNQYFQYKAYFASDDYLWNPKLQGVRVDTATYPQDNPTVMPVTSFYFPGNLLGYSHLMGTTNGDAMIRYHLSGNNGTNWFYWDGTHWSDVTGFGWDLANPVSVVSANIGQFFSQLYAKTGGNFKFKAFIHSTGIDQTSLDQVDLGYSTGRIVVTSPNGGEIGPLAWLVGVTNIITWTTNGTVSPTVVIEYSDTSGTNWATVAAAAPNTGSYAWLTPGGGVNAERSTCRIRVRDPNDATVWDMSDSDFQLVYRYKIIVPNGGEKWYIGETNMIVWQSPPNVGSYSWLYYNIAGSTSVWSRIGPVDVPNIQGITNNTYAWITPTTNNALLSEQARVRITLQGSIAREDWSDNDYIMAGIGFITPDSLTAWKRGSSNTLTWISSGAGASGVDIDFANDGVTWTNIATAVANQTGTNSWGWIVSTPNPSPIARFRITARADNRTKGISRAFTVADIDIKSPNNTNVWTQGETNHIVWTAGGAGTSVNIYYSTNNGVGWLPVIMGYTNLDYPAINDYAWKVPQTPSVTIKVRVQSTLGFGELYADSEAFSIAGILITSPNGGELWTINLPNQVQWNQAAAGGGALIQFSYDDGTTFTNIGGPGYPLEALSYDYTPDLPSVRCWARVQASDAGKTNIFDLSDTYFTVAGLKATTPALAALYTMGWTATNGIRWYSAGTLADNVNLYYAPEDGPQQLIVNYPNGETYPGFNQRDWNPAMSLDPSLKGHVKVIANGSSGSYTGLTSVFTLRGVRVTQPAAGTVFRIGNDENIIWLSAGFDPGASAEFYLSTDGGSTFGASPLLGWLTALDLKTAIWTVGANVTPTTNAVIKLSVTNDVIPFVALSPAFTLRGIQILAPSSTNIWNIGTTNTIQFLAAGAGTLCSIYYSQDGVTYDMAHPIAANIAMHDGLNQVNWAVESFRTPSATSKIKIQSQTLPDNAISSTFTLGGIKVTRPVSTDIWSIGETNQIQWISVGTTGTNTLDLIMPGPVVLPITNHWTGTSFDWVVPTEAVGSNLMIRIIDMNGFTAYSVPFRIVPEPTIQIVSPVADEFWKVEAPHTIQWAKAGNMSANFNIEYSLNNFASSVQILGTPSLADGMYSLPWTPVDPTKMGAARIRITNMDVTNITDTSSTFYLAPNLTITAPNGTEQFYALKPTIVQWNTKGNVTAFDLYYSTDLARGTGSWIKVNTTGTIPGNGHDTASTYLWTVANVKSSNVWLRLQDANYTTLMPADVAGPYDDIDGTFAINYFTIMWNVFDATTSNSLAQLSVSDSSGWSDSGLASSPYVIHEYPYGVFDTIWSREYFNDQIIFHWVSEPSRIINVPMRQAAASPEYHVMANFVFDPTNGIFKTAAWLERNSQIITDPSSCSVFVYDPEGNLTHQVNSSSPRASGVFWIDIPALTDKNRPYFARVEISRSGSSYSSGLTFTLLSPSESSIAAINAAAANILASVSNVNDNVTGVGLAQTAFRNDVTNRLSQLSNTTARVDSNVSVLSSNLSGLNTNLLVQLAALTNAIGVIGPTGTNLLDQTAALRNEVEKRTARILTRPSSIKRGSAVTVMYRSKAGLSPTITATDAASGVYGAYSMTALSGGVYEYTFTANWALGDCRILCSDNDSSGTSDSIIMKCTQTEVDDLASTMGLVSNQLAHLDITLAGLSSSMSNVQFSVDGMTNSLAFMLNDLDYMSNVIDRIVILTNINPSVAALTGAVDRVLVLTNMSGQLEYITNKVGLLADIPPQMIGLTNSMARLTQIMTNGMTSLSGQMAYVTNVIDKIVVLTNINPAVAAMTNAVGQISGLTNMSGQLTAIADSVAAMSGLTNMTSQLNSISNSVSQLGGLSNSVASLNSQVRYLTNLTTQISVVTNLGPQVAYLTNAVDQIIGLTNINPAVAAMTNAVAQITVLTNMSSQLTFVTNVVGQMGVLTNLTPQMASLTNSMAHLILITNSISSLSAQMSYVTNVIDQIVVLTNINPAVAAMTGAVAQISGLTNMTDQLNFLTNTMYQVQALTNLNVQFASLSNMTANIGGQTASLTNLVTRMAGLTNLTPQVGYLTNSMGMLLALTNAPAQLGSLTNMVGQLTSLTNINSQVSAMTNSIAQVAGLTNFSAQMNYMTNVISQMSGITNIGPQVAAMTNSIAQVAAMTNLPSQMNYMTNVIAQMTGITNIAPQVAQMTNAIAQIAGMTNFASQVNYMTNVISQMTGITNIAPQVASMTNAIAQISNMTNMPAQMNSMTNIIAQLGGMTNVAAQVAALTNVTDQLSYMTNLISQVNGTTLGLSNVVWSLSGLTNVNSQMSSLSNLVGQMSGTTSSMSNMLWSLAGLTNMPSQMDSLTNGLAILGGVTNLGPQVAYLTNMVGNMSSITNIAPQVASMTNAIGQIASMTNFATQLNYMTNVINQLTSITNIGQQVASMTNSIAQVAAMTNLPAQMAYMTNIMSELTGITNIAPQVASMTNAIGEIAAMTNFATQINYLTNVIENLTGITNIAPQVASMTNAIGQISNMTNMPAQMNYMTNVIAQLSGMTNVAAQVAALTNVTDQLAYLTNLVNQLSGTTAGITNSLSGLSGMTNLEAQLSYVTNLLAGLSGVTNVGPQIASMTNSLAQVAGLTNFSAQMNYMTNVISQLTSITNIGDQVSSMTNAIGQVAGLTNFTSQMNYMTNVISQLTSITNIGDQVSSMTNAIGQIAGLTNFSAQMNYMTNVISQLTSITNIGDQVSSMTNAIGQITGLTNMSGQLNYLTNIVSGLVGLTNLSEMIGSLTNGLSQLGGLSNLTSQLGGLTNLTDVVGGLTNLPTQLAGLTNLPSQIGDMGASLYGLTNMPYQLAVLTNTIGSLTALTNLSDQVAIMTNAIGQITTMTNLQTQVSYLTNLPSQVSTMTNVSVQLSSISNLYLSIESRIGSVTDASSQSTVFGRLTALEQNVNAVGTTASSAASKASGARSQANSAASGLQRIKQEIGAGQVSRIATDVADVRKSLADALKQVQEVPGSMSTKDLIKTLNDATEAIRGAAAGRGIASPLGQPDSKLEPGSLNDPKAVADLLNRLTETKAMMEATRQLMDEAVNKPVVVDWLESTK